ncbi:DUF1553 domain-containing protein [bacterium]|nr:DUF1553 domain-containing protein [bacterium]
MSSIDIRTIPANSHRLRPPGVLRLILAVMTGTIVSQTILADDRSAQDGIAFFESRIRPVLVEHCYKCHSAESKQAKGGLRLDTRSDIRKGGDSGPAVVPGDVDESLIVQAVAYDGGFYDMPPSGKLPETAIADIREWIRLGAPDPRESAPGTQPVKSEGSSTRQNHWAFQPVKSPTIPETADPAWPIDPVDRFILAGLEKLGTKPAAPATRTAWLRRVWFDLVGLPPSPESIRAFVEDPRPDAEARAAVVDALLAMPQFGERWGRHWLDVARFAESSGGGRTLLFKDAWRYRDYVIQAFDSDMPYDRFLREQIAGDLLTAKDDADRARLLTATGFLVLGPTNYEEQEKYQLRMDIVDEQMDTLGKTVLGMTIGCARCHDHKFDPIPTRDYYALAGIFRSTRTLANDTDNVARWIDTPLPATGDFSRRIAAHEKEVQELESSAKRIREEILRLDPRTAALAGEGPVNPADLPGIALDDSAAKAVGGWKASTYGGKFLGSGAVYDEKRKEGPSTLTFDPEIRKSGKYEVRLAYVAHENRSTRTPVTILHADGEELKRVNQRETPPVEGRFVSLGTFRFEAGGAGFVLISNEGADGAVSVDGVWFLPVDSVSESANDAGGSEQLAKLRRSLTETEKRLKEKKAQAPPRALAMTVREHEKIEDSPIHIRGNIKTLGPRVPRGVLSVVSTVPFEPVPEGASGRAELAEWLTDRRHPLTSRVMVNRVWLWLFGEGLVRSADNFGTTGEMPSHPELLDHLATRFMADGWSVKKLVRAIVTSNTYAMSDISSEKSVRIDPENRFLSRFPRRRLDAESMRDAMLSAAGLLDMTFGGPNIAGAKAIDANDNGAASLEYGYKFEDVRRSVYAPAFRNKRHDLFEAFDFADINQPLSKRERSTVAPQALFFMNHPFVRTMAEKCAQRVTDENLKDAPARLDSLCLRILSRQATEAEAAALLPAVVDAENEDERLQAWADVAHALFASVEFRYTH